MSNKRTAMKRTNVYADPEDPWIAAIFVPCGRSPAIGRSDCCSTICEAGARPGADQIGSTCTPLSCSAHLSPPG